MSEIVHIIISLETYRIITILVGLVVVYLGYKLFLKSVYAAAGDFTVEWKGLKILLTKGAPGTFFALFGVIIIVVSLWRGISVFEIRRDIYGDVSAVAAFGENKETRQRLVYILEKVSDGKQISEREREFLKDELSKRIEEY